MKKILLVCCLIMGFISLGALDIPPLKGRVNDLAGLLDEGTRLRIESLLASLEEKTGGIQLAVLTLPGLEGEDLNDYTYRVATAWKLGQSGQNNGALLLVALAERKIRIEVGYGLEEFLTDAKSSYIINRDMIPRFKQGDFSGGILAGVESMVGVVGGDADISASDMERYNRDQRKKSKGGLPVGLVIGFWILVFILRSRGGRGGRGGGMFWMGGLGGSSGGFGGGGSSFGGFSGGGGSFGGGGSSGSW